MTTPTSRHCVSLYIKSVTSRHCVSLYIKSVTSRHCVSLYIKSVTSRHCVSLYIKSVTSRHCVSLYIKSVTPNSAVTSQLGLAHVTSEATDGHSLWSVVGADNNVSQLSHVTINPSVGCQHKLKSLPQTKAWSHG